MPGPSWVRHACTGFTGYARTDTLTTDEQFFVDNHARATTLVETSDQSAYDYDDYALAELDGVLYVFNTSGCSCPTPEETWSLCLMGDRSAVIAWVDSHGDDSGFLEFKRALEKAGFAFAVPAPTAEPARDW